MLFKAAALALGVIIIYNLWRIRMSLADATQRAEALAARAEKVQIEVRDSLAAARTEIQALKDQIANGVPPDTTALEAALSRAEAAVAGVDAENPDADSPAARKS